MLWLLRHGQAADGVPDDERPLTELGRHQSQAAGLALVRLGVRIELCLTSPKLRALETARLACEPLGIDAVVEPALSGEPFDPWGLAGKVDEVLLVGHDPSFSTALHELTGVQARMRKGGLASVKKGELVTLMRPAELVAIAGLSEVSV